MSRFSHRVVRSIVLLVCTALVGQVCWADQGRVRRWTDASGKYRVEASFVDFEGGSVRLVKSDGTNVLVRFKRLGSSDQNYVRSRLRQRQIGRRKKPLPVGGLRSSETSFVRADVKTVYGINWHPANSLHVAAAGKIPKPVMWFRVLGSLDGFM